MQWRDRVSLVEKTIVESFKNVDLPENRRKKKKNIYIYIYIYIRIDDIKRE